MNDTRTVETEAEVLEIGCWGTSKKCKVPGTRQILSRSYTKELSAGINQRRDIFNVIHSKA